MSEELLKKPSDFLFYKGHDGNISVQIIVDSETESVWTTHKGMAEIFGTTKQNISSHISNIYKEGELDEISTVKKILTVQNEGEREVERKIDFYNLDVIIAVGYRVNSYNATQFRVWATRVLKEYLIKGFSLDDERLKQGKKIFGKDYFEELLERIREIRASERRFYQKITDIYAECSIDYDAKSPITQTFFATVQNKLEFAITGNTAPEIIKSRASASKPFMGLKTWSKAPNGKVLKADVTVAKNYLDETELKELNQIVDLYLSYAELQAKRNKAMTMGDWVHRLDAFLSFNEYDILADAGKIRKQVAASFAEKEYDKFRVIQDREYRSDFDEVVEQIKNTKQLPEERSTKREAEPLNKFKKDAKRISRLPKAKGKKQK